MEYKIVCPKCGARLSRWHWMLSVTEYRCRNCQARFCMTFLGWLMTVGVILEEFLWFALFQVKVISMGVAIGLVVATCVVGTWALPYWTPVQPARREIRK